MHLAWRSSLLVVAGLLAGRPSAAQETTAPLGSAGDAASPEAPAPATSTVHPDPAVPGPSDVVATEPGAVAVPRTNYVPNVLRLPDMGAVFDLSLLVRSSPRGVDGTLVGAAAKGFRFDRATVPVGSGGAMLGGSMGVSIVVLNRYIFPTIGLDFLQSIGSRARLLSGQGGHVLTAETWRTLQVGGTLFGFGVRGRHRRFAGSLLVEPGFVAQWTPLTTPGYERKIEGSAVAISGRLLLTGTACRKLDPELRLCLSVSPHVYAFGPFNGVTLGFRTEIGP